MTGPLAVTIYWDLPVILALISLVYSATRFDRWDLIFGEALRWGLRMTAFLAAIGLALYAAAAFAR